MKKGKEQPEDLARLLFLHWVKAAILAKNEEEVVCKNWKLGRYRKKKAGEIIQIYKQVQEMNEDITLTIE